MVQTMLELKKNRQKKLALLEQMLALTETEKTQLLEDQVEELVDTTKRWEKLAAEIDSLERAFADSLRPLLAQDAKRPLGEDTPAFEALEASARAILDTIQQVQVECNTLAAEKMEQYKTDLKSVQKSNQRVTSYANPYSISEDGLYFDQKK